MKLKRNKSKFDKTLRPESSFAKGFEYICDVDIHTAEDASEIIEELITLYQGKLGAPRKIDVGQHMFGLYFPIDMLTPQLFSMLTALPAFDLKQYNKIKMEKLQKELHTLII